MGSEITMGCCANDNNRSLTKPRPSVPQETVPPGDTTADASAEAPVGESTLEENTLQAVVQEETAEPEDLEMGQQGSNEELMLGETYTYGRPDYSEVNPNPALRALIAFYSQGILSHVRLMSVFAKILLCMRLHYRFEPYG